MIVRIATEGQYELSDEVAARVNGLDNDVVAAVDAGDEARFVELFARMIETIRSEGARLDGDDLRSSDVIVPPPDTSFEEARHDFSGDGLIPD